MTFDEILEQVIALLQRQRRVAYGALKRRFALDNAYLDDLKDELIYARQVAVDEDNKVLVWTGVASPLPETISISAQPQMPHDDTPQVEPLPAERRQLTVMFCDLADSTALAGQLDPEDLREVVRAYQQTSAEVIQRFDGHIAQYLGDGLLVYFGYPQAHEDDALRAVHAGLEIVAAMRTLNVRLEQERGLRLAVRLGIHTGLVVVGEMGGGERHGQLALGETPNLAARLQGLAALDTVVISAATMHLVEGYVVCQALGVHTLRGVAAPVTVYRVLRPNVAQSRLDVAGARGLTPFVGRESEVALLLERWTQVKEGTGHVVLLHGEAGIGKSRLVQVLKDHAAGEAHTRLECRCSPYYQNSALYPLIDLLQRALRWQESETPVERLEKLEHTLGQYRLALDETVPLLAALLSLPLPEGRYPPLTLTPQRQKQKTLEAILAMVLELAERQPVLFIVEDLHWLDPSTLEFLGLLIEQGPTARLLTLLTYRPTFQSPWTGRAHVTPLTLTRLPAAQVEAMVARLTNGKPLPAEVLHHVVANTDGVPLFVEELTKMLLESGLLTEADDRYALAGPLPSLAIPTTLHDSLMARLDRLAAVKVVAQLGATLGRQFSYSLLQAVSPLDEPTLQQGLQQLVDAELLYRRGVPPQATYLFKHALIQEAAYQSLLKSTRQQYHQRIAQVLEERFPETAETQPELLAQHYTAAGLHAQALPYWQWAGQLALERSAHREAVASLERGLAALPHLPQNRATLEQAVDLRLLMRTALQGSGDLGRILACLREAESLAIALDDSRRLGQVSLFLSNYFNYIGAYDQSIAIAQRLLVLATTNGEGGEQALAKMRLGQAYHAQSDYRRAIDYFAQTLASLDGARRYERFGNAVLPAVDACARLAWCYAELGTFAEGRALGEEGGRIAKAVDHPGSLMVSSLGAGMLALRQGDLYRAIPLLEQAVGICQEADLPTYFPRSAAALGAAYTMDGRIADAIPLLTQAVEQIIAMETVAFQAFCTLSLGEAQVLAGRLEEAHTLAERALALARAHQERGHQAYALRLLGEIAARHDPPQTAPAEAHFQQAMALADELGMRPLVAHCHLGLGMLHGQVGQLDQARTALSTAIALYRAMDMTFWLPQAEAALAQISTC